jgi:hypothetical protein
MRIILTILLCLLLLGCTQPIIADTIPETVIVTETVIVEVKDTKTIIELEKQLQSKDIEIKQYKDLISNLNELLGCVGHIEGTNSNYKNEGTAFSIEYQDKYYIISAGHLVENEYGKFSNFKYKGIISVDLLKYESDFNLNKDYAIFYSDKIKQGLDYNLENADTRFILGYNDLIQILDYSALKEGQSGSPIININGKVVGIATGFRTDIDKVIQALDSF